MVKNCDNCIYSGRPSYEYPCTACETAYGSAPSKWEGMVPATADMVEVVRCKDCKHRADLLDCGNYLCNRKMIGMVRPNDFCSFGERKDND